MASKKIPQTRRRPQICEMPLVKDAIPGHVHHWFIDTADGPTSRGVCKWCGEQKTFYNALPELDQVPPVTALASSPIRPASAYRYEIMRVFVR